MAHYSSQDFCQSTIKNKEKVQLGKRASISTTNFDTSTKLLKLSRGIFDQENEGLSSSTAVTSENHIIYYDGFLQFPISLKGGNQTFNIRVDKWAEAYLAFSLAKITKILCQSLITREDVENGIPMEKQFAIKSGLQHGSMWKNKDPYSFKHVSQPNKKDGQIMDRIFAAFTTQDCIPSAHYDESLDIVNEEINKILEEWDIMGDENAEMDIKYNDDITAIVLRKFRTIVSYPLLFRRRMMEASSNLNSAQMAKQLTKDTIKQNTDKFILGVQFSEARWETACKKKGVGPIACALFGKLMALENISTGFDGLDSPRKVAITCATAFIRKFQNEVMIPEFDSNNPEHNVFLTENEIDEIKEYILQERVEKKLKNLSISTHSSSSALSMQPQSSSSPGINSSDLIMVGDHSIPAKIWEKAIVECKDNDRGIQKAGAILFRSIFTEDEKLHCFYCDRKGQRIFPPEKKYKLIELLRHLQGLQNGQGIAFQFSKCERKEIEYAIFVDLANRSRNGRWK